jgi:DNA modification methylase
MEDLKKSLQKFNLVEIPAIDTDGTIIAGHQRIKALQLLDRGDEIIDVRIPNRKLTEKESRTYMVGSNSLGGTWDFEKLQKFDKDLLLEIGFEPIEIAKIWKDEFKVENDDFNEKKELQKIKEPTVKLGDVIILGNHKLVCGDSTDPKVLDRLFGEEKASMVYSDPVYNINLNYNSGVGGKQNYGADVKDDRSEIEYFNLINNSMKNALAHSHDDLHIFYWSDQKYIWLMQTLYTAHGIENKRVCLWVKNGHNPTPGVAFNKCYEPCTYGVRGKPYLGPEKGFTEILNTDIGNGNQSFDDIWTIKRLARDDYAHATSKPPKLHESAMLRCTKPGDIILDSFGGSGSTLISGEMLQRRVFMVELEPVFCELIIRRFEKLTGIKAQIIHEAA